MSAQPVIKAAFPQSIDMGNGVSIDLPILMGSRMLVQANSGGGKSFFLRRLIEQAFGKIQIIVIDPEGEFSTLREKFDFVLVGPGGETPADVRSAGLVARKFLELGVSAVCDLYEMKAADRHVWVKNFLDSMINAPKNLWKPVLVIVDEAHLFCPEKGQGDSAAQEAMTDLCTRGRKRGFVACWATQRLGKLLKSASSELHTRFVGLTFEDVDRKRAADLLGVSGSDLKDFNRQLQMFEPGNFFAYGRAVSLERRLFKVGPIKTTHPEAGSMKHSAGPPPAPAQIRKLLPQLADLPQEAEKKAQTEAELRKENTELKRQLAAQKVEPQVQVQVEEKIVEKVIEVPILLDANLESLQEIMSHYESVFHQFDQKRLEITQTVLDAGELQKRFIAAKSAPAQQQIRTKPLLIPRAPARLSDHKSAPVRMVEANDAGGTKMTKANRSILTALAQHGICRKGKVAALAGYAVGGGAFKNALSECRVAGWLVGSDPVEITDLGLEALGDYTPLPAGEQLFDHWMDQLEDKAQKEIFRVLYDVYNGGPIDKVNLAAQTVSSEGTPYEPAGGGFKNALSRLRVLNLAEGSSSIQFTKDLKEALGLA